MSASKLNQSQLLDGRIYTPPKVIDLMLDLANIPSHQAFTILDPACGDGAILARCSIRLNVSSRLEGIEIDQATFKAANERLRPLAGAGKHALFLRLGDALQLIPQLENRYDYVIANPPYVAWHKIATPVRDGIMHQIHLAGDFFGCSLIGRPNHQDQQPDLALFFLLLGLKALTAGGRLVYLLPMEWFTARRADPLRNLLSSATTIQNIVVFSPEKSIFWDQRVTAHTSSMMLVIDRKSPTSDHQIQCHFIDSKAYQGSDSPNLAGVVSASVLASASLQTWTLSQARLTRGSWSVKPPQSRWAAPMSGTQPLGRCPGIRVMGGHQPPVLFLEWLTLSAEEFAQLPDRERVVVYPALHHAAEITFPIIRSPRSYWVLFDPAWSETKARAMAPSTFELIREKWVQWQKRRPDLYGNPLVKNWWIFPNRRNMVRVASNQPRLIVPRTSLDVMVAYDTFGHHIKGTNTLILLDNAAPATLHTLFGLLNSQIIKEWARHYGRSYHGVRLYQEPTDVRAFPIPCLLPAPEFGLVREMDEAVAIVLDGGDQWKTIHRIAFALYNERLVI